MNIELAQSLFKLNKYQEIIDNCEKILATDSKSIEAIKLIAKSYLATRKIEDARSYFNKALTLKPDDYEVIKDLGNTYQAVGDINSAKNFYKKAIEINSSFAPALTNLGSIEIKTGNKEEGLSLLIKATESDPQSAPAWGNLGNGYVQLEKYEEAQNCCEKAININPELHNYYYRLAKKLIKTNKLKGAEMILKKIIEIKTNFFLGYLSLGTVLFKLNNLKEAKFYTYKAIEINPEEGYSYLNLGEIYLRNGEIEKSFDCFYKAIILSPNNKIIQDKNVNFLISSDLSKINKNNLRDILILLLEKDHINHENLLPALNKYYHVKINDYEYISGQKSTHKQKINTIINDQLIRISLRKLVLKSIFWERLFIQIREYICLNHHNIFKNKKIKLSFITALASQCFLNEYIYSTTDSEDLSIEKIIMKFKENSYINELDIALLGCYFPLYKFPKLKDIQTSNQDLKNLLQLQLNEPLKEIELTKSIKKIGIIHDNISQKVREQYESNPYPRWNSLVKPHKVNYLEAINSEIFPNTITTYIDPNPLKILIAGCGTGYQIHQAQRYNNSQITAIDLSTASLAYAQRKITEMNIPNVELIQMDILELHLLKKKFDIIECGGVLHHMNDPSIGLKSLSDSLKIKGFMKLGLYSELARKNVVKAREYLKMENKANFNKKNMNSLRKGIMNRDFPELISLTNTHDFYTSSMFRDLCFHVHEHRFKIFEIEKILNFLNLKFLGFVISNSIKSQYINCYKEDKSLINLKNWSSYEENHPNTFKGMYNFWVCKSK